jgi:FkbM family methyltransferase
MFFSKVIRQIFRPDLINNFKSFLGLSVEDPNFEFKRISKLGRFKNGETDLIHNGFRFLDSESFINQFHDIYRRELLRFSSSIKNPLILDCGSNIGVSVCYFKKIYPDSRIIAFEPDQKIFSTLKHNTQNFNSSNLKLHNSAVWTENTNLRFISNGADGGKIGHNGDQSVGAQKLSNFLSNRVNMLKIDIEGAEKFVLPSIAEYLKNVEYLFLELHIDKNEPELLEQTCQLLRANRFRYKIDSVGLVNFSSFENQDEHAMQLNILAVNDNFRNIRFS